MNNEAPPRFARIKSIAKIAVSAVGVVGPVAVAAYYWQAVTTHILVPGFSNQEHAIASSILIGAAVAITIAMRVGITLRVRDTARRHGKLEEQRVWEQKTADFKEFQTRLSRLRERLALDGTDPPKAAVFESLNKSSSKLLGEWYDLVTNEKESHEVRLAGRALNAYLGELIRLEQPGTGYTLLLANFEIYAFCAQAILKELISLRPSSEGTIYVSTILTMPLNRWYNLSSDVSAGGTISAFTSSNIWVYLIAKHKEGDVSCSADHRPWKPLREDHFETTYHNGVHCTQNQVDAEQKGMFCGYIPEPYPIAHYEDIVTVDMRNVGEGSFGIGFHRDNQGERHGIVFFNDGEVKKHIENLNFYWDLAGNVLH